MSSKAMAEVKLHGTWASPFSQRVIWALKLKGIDYEYIEEDLANKSELLLSYNPVHKKIPVLVHGGKPIAESLVILEYIEETWPEAHPLLPHDAYDRANARFWVKVVSEENRALFLSYFGGTGEEQEKAAKDFLQRLKVIEEHGLGDKKFFGGDEINLVDICCGWLAYFFPVMEQVAGIKLLEPTTLPRLYEWAENFKDVPVIRENLPDLAKLKTHLSRNRERLLATATANNS
ncbi:hypothetical protein COLO4_34332 [Corchorus olitorius]|uniref:Glutathione S-transferase n=1 Tax=Corchorus olitorius TaxID=93759 RepID=A0A1R3GLU3_9ROSI|nr:hypothetical protein COLO4_34332 [Corchorus olitorius]